MVIYSQKWEGKNGLGGTEGGSVSERSRIRARPPTYIKTKKIKKITNIKQYERDIAN